MKLPSCLVGGDRSATQHSPDIPHDAAKRRKSGNHNHGNKKVATARFVGLALFLTSVFSDTAPLGIPTNALSSSISTISVPSALYQFASFLALEENAEEAGTSKFLDGSSHSKGQHRSASSASSSSSASVERVIMRNIRVVDPSSNEGRSSSRHRAKVTVRETLLQTGCLARPATAIPDIAAFHPQHHDHHFAVDDSTSSTLSNSGLNDLTASSAGTPRSDVSTSPTTMTSSSLATSKRAPPSSKKHHRHHSSTEPLAACPLSKNPWRQVHVSELAAATGNERFVNDTNAMLQRHLFPTIYVCHVKDILMEEGHHSTTTTSSSSSGGTPPSAQPWTCAKCGKRHRDVREACLQCNTLSPTTAKLFIGQLRKEVACDDLIRAIVTATTLDEKNVPTIVPQRYEGHTYQGMRGKGCGSLYVSPAEADRLSTLLHRNVFIDMDPVTGDELLYFAYTEQRAWLEGFANTLVMMQGVHRPAWLPNKLVVCEAAGSTSIQTAPSQQKQQPFAKGKMGRSNGKHNSTTLFVEARTM